MKNSNSMTAAEAKAYFTKEKKPLKAKAEKKVQSAAEQMDISSTPIERIIDGLVCKVGEIVDYHRLHIAVTLDNQEYIIKVEKA